MSQTPATFAPGPEHARIATIVGTWVGAASTWLDPSAPPETSTWNIVGTSLLGGRFVRLSYDGVVSGQPHAGELMLAYERDEARYTTTWIDTFHTGTQVLVSTGAPDEEALDVRGSYPAGPDQRWGWRTQIRGVDNGFVIAMFNIGPDGEEFPAIEVRLG
jgi:hypothetical protein